MDKSLSYKGLSLHTSSGTSYLILFIIWPFLAFLIALADYSRKEARAVIFFFLVYFGLTFVSDNELMDSFRYVETWRFYASLPLSDIFRAVGGYYSYSSSVDFVEPLVAFLISRITGSHHVFFAVFAGIFAFFYLRSYNLLFDQYKGSPNWNSWVFMIFTLVVIPITSLSVLRMWIAAWIFFFWTFQVLQTHKFKYVLLALSACLVHWSFISIGLLLIGYYFAGNRRLIYTPLAIGSFFISQFLDPILEFVALSFGGGIGEDTRRVAEVETFRIGGYWRGCTFWC